MGTATASRWRCSGPVLGIDLSLRYSGLSLYSAAGIHLNCWTIEELLSRGSKKDPPIPEPERIERVCRIANQIVRVVTKHQVRHVGIEGPAHNKRFQSHQLGEVAGAVKTQLWLKFGIAPRIVPPSSARKHVMGYGGAGITKMMVREIVEKGLGVAVENDHEADATVIARYTFDTVVAEEEELDV